MAIMYLSEEYFTCPKEHKIHKQLSLSLTVLIPNVNFIYCNGITSHLREVKALARLCICTGLPEPSQLAFSISPKISCSGSYDLYPCMKQLVFPQISLYY